MIRFVCKTGKGIKSGKGFDYPKKGLLWLHVTDPTELEIERIRKQFKIPSKIFERYKKEKRSTRYSFKPLAFVLVDYYNKAGKILVDDVLYVVGKNFLITVSKQKLSNYDEAFELMKTKLNKIENVGYLLYEVLDYDVEKNYDVLRLTESRISEIEEMVLHEGNVKEKITKVVNMKRELLTMWRRYWSSAKILFSIKKGLTPINVGYDLLRLLDDVHDSFVHQMDIVSSQREVLTDALTIHQAIIANKLAVFSNKINMSVKRLTWVMFVLTGVATVLTVPNTIATIFGIPEWPITGDQWRPIAYLLIISMIIPTIWFYFYWKSVKKQAEEHGGK